MARGLSPVITTVLLLLISIAAVGGAWLWYQRMSNTLTSGGAEQTEKIKQGAALNWLYVDGVASGVNQTLDIVVGNAGTETISVDQIKVEVDGTTLDCTSDVTFEAGSINTVNCPSINYTTQIKGKRVTINFIVGGLTKSDVVTAQ